jgi:hypothetical protein
VLGRVLGLGVTGSATVGTIFVLSGPFAAWLGYPFDAVNCWAGWLLAFGILAVRDRRPMLAVTGLAWVTAGILYGGQPELAFRTSRFGFGPPFRLVSESLTRSAALGLTKQDLPGST